MKLKLKILSLMALGALASSGCGDDKKSKDINSNKDPRRLNELQDNPLQLIAQMHDFDSCASAETHLKNQLKKWMHQSFEQSKKYYRPSIVQRAPQANTENDMAAGSAKSGPTDFTTTNNQVAGVEEADFVKNDGKHIYQLAMGKLNIMTSWPADKMKLVSSLKLDGHFDQMLLDGNTLILLGQAPSNEIPDGKKVDSSQSSDFILPQYNSHYAKILVLDIAQKSRPKELESYVVKGHIMGSRRIDRAIRIVLTDGFEDLNLPTYLEWHVAEKLTPAERAKKLERLEKENKAKINKMTIDDLLVKNKMFHTKKGVKKEIALSKNCRQIKAPNLDTDLGLTRIVTLNVGAKKLDQTILLTRVSQLYSSEKSLYLATPYWWWDNQSMNTTFTYLHKFDLSQVGGATYLGSGGVQGTLLNQFAMDEHNDVLRVATTIQEREPDTNNELWWGNWKTSNRVSTFKLADTGELNKVGETPDLAENESIFAVRFQGDRGFVVTFEQIDPLFTLDLTNPEKPAIVGELKIPGFSNYMQLIDENHILAVGMAGDMDGRVQGMKISLFDVTNLAKPTEAHSYIFSESSWSEASYDHKAFTYFPAKKVLGIPVATWDPSYTNDLHIFDIDVNKGIEKRGEVSLDDLSAVDRNYNWWYHSAQVSRSIFADDYVYAISNLGVRSASLDDLSNHLSTVSFECDNSCFNSYGYFE